MSEKNVMYEVVATDLDGTLLQNGIRTLRDDIIPAIKDYIRRGGIFLPASGRQYASLRRLFAGVEDEIAYIAENGCLVFYQGELLYKSVMDRKYGLELVDAISSIDGAQVVVSGVNCSYIRRRDKEFLDYITNFVKNNVTPVDEMDDIEEDFFKISAYSSEGTALFEDILKEKFSDRLNVVTSGNCWTDVMPKGVHKGSGIRVLSDKLGISLENMAALGDHYNDYEMLSAVGHPACVDNAKPEIMNICEKHMECGSDLLLHYLGVK